MFERIRDWYEGKFVLHENDPVSGVVFIGGYYERHWTATIARALVHFYLEHWKWLWGFGLSVVGLYFAWLKF